MSRRAEQADGVADRARIVVAEGRWFHAMRTVLSGAAASLYIAGKPCLNPKNNKSPKYGTVARHSRRSYDQEPDETRHLSLSRAEDARRSGRDAGGGRARRRPRAGRRAEPGADHGVPAGGADAPRRHQRHRGAGRRSRSQTASSAIGACVRHAAFYEPVCEGPLGRAARDGRAQHRATIRSAPAAPSAAAWRTPIRPRNGARSSPRSTPRWWRRSKRGTRIIAAKDYFDGIMTTALQDDEIADRGAAAVAARGHPRRLPGICPPRRRLRARAWRW